MSRTRPLRALLFTVCLAALPALAQDGATESYGWEDISFGLQSTRITAVAVPPDRQNVIYVAAQGEVYVSTDAGVTWERLLTIRGTGLAGAEDEEGISDQELADLEEEARSEALQALREELREEIIDDLEDELGRDLAEEIADDTAEELAEDLLEEDAVDERLRDEVDRLPSERRPSQLGGGFGDLGTQTGDGEPAAEAVSPDFIFRLEVAAGGRILVASADGLYISTDGGATFENAQPSFGAEAREVRVAAWDPHDPERIYAGTSEGMYFSVNGGQTWSRSVGEVDRGAVTDIAIDPHAEDTLLASTTTGIYRSEDGAMTFEEVWAPVGEDLGNVRAVAFDGGLVNHVYAGTAAGLVLSVDGGASFGLVVPAGLTSQEITDLDTWAGREGAVVVATRSGIFASDDGAEQFTQGYPGLPARIVHRVATRPRFPEVHAATGSGLFVWQKLAEQIPEPVWVGEVVRSAPPLPDIVGVAAEHAGIRNDWFGSMYRRAGAAWMAPQVSASWRVNYEDDRVEALEDPRREPDEPFTRQQWSLDDDFRWEVRARWNLDQALYAPDRLAVSRTWRALRQERDRVLDRVAGLYTAWLSYSVRARRGTKNPKEAVLLALSIQETEAQLDALTGGWFSRARRELSSPEQIPPGAE